MTTKYETNPAVRRWTVRKGTVGAVLKPKQYYLDRAAQMRELAQTASNDFVRQSFLKAADAYLALAENASDGGGEDPKPGK